MVALDDVVKLFDQSGGFFVCQVKVHKSDMGWRLPVAKAEPRLPIASPVDVIAPAL
jgi:hypothetical protein